MQETKKSRVFFGLWAVMAVTLGAVLMSFHQPFVLPQGGVGSLVGPGDGRHWRAVHLVSGSCGCSQRVMQHLLARGRQSDLQEQVIVVDGEEDYLPGSAKLMGALAAGGFAVRHLRASEVPAKAGLHGVPMLVFIRPDGQPAYVGGYGMDADGGEAIFREAQAGVTPRWRPVFGCAVSSALRRAVDPFGLKYR